eukprot:Selendium_serpulae@DN5879_c1_g1_i3.p1
MTAIAPAATSHGTGPSTVGDKLGRNERRYEVQYKNIIAAKSVTDMIRTSLGPRGMDKMIQGSKGNVMITNDGASILKEMSVIAPTAKMLVELSKAQDVEAGDGTTSVVVIAGAFLSAAQQLLDKGIHVQLISRCFIDASKKAAEILEGLAVPTDLSNRDALVQSAS